MELEGGSNGMGNVQLLFMGRYRIAGYTGSHGKKNEIEINRSPHTSQGAGGSCGFSTELVGEVYEFITVSELEPVPISGL